jgi:para-nitrobenzyl esterase
VSTIMAMPDASGLFHRAIVQSGSYARNAHLQAMSPAEGTRHARTLLSALEIAPGDATKLASLPVDALVAGVSKVARGPDRAIWRPVPDGKVLPGGEYLLAYIASCPVRYRTTRDQPSVFELKHPITICGAGLDR